MRHNAVEEQVKKLQHQLQHISANRIPTNPNDCSERHVRRLKKQRTDSCSASLEWLQSEGYKPVKLEVQKIEDGKTEIISFDALESEYIFGHNPPQDELDTVNMMLFIKDRFDVSGQAYHEMAKVFKQLPRHYQLKKRIVALNTLRNIKPTPNGTHGVQQSLCDRLSVRLKRLIETTSSEATFKVERKVRVKLSGDGTRIGKRLHVVNFTFTLIDEGYKAYACEGNHILAIFKDDQVYQGWTQTFEKNRICLY